ncbi:caspase family protein [Geitlerinema sp. CS-897]|nr:caspase family protein [Geitlerinema sp. CS-897]
MTKTALLIGVSQYAAGLTPLPGAIADVNAMKAVLENRELGGFDRVKTLLDPDLQQMEQEIELLFSNCQKGDLALLFFSGHGIKDESGRLYFATRITKKSQSGELLKSTAVPANFVQDMMSGSRCKRQIVMLDCCFSGAFAEGMTAKDDRTVDVRSQLGGEGRAVLTSSTAIQYSFEQENEELSVYTRYLVEGIRTGAADLDADGKISIDELHDYARQKVREAAPAMKPKIFAVEEGFRIIVANAARQDPELRYRQEVDRFVRDGQISEVARLALDALREQLQLDSEVARQIEAEVLEPHRKYQQNLAHYEQAFEKTVQNEFPLSEATRQELSRLRDVLGLRAEDVAAIEERLTPKVSEKPAIEPGIPEKPHDESPREPDVKRDRRFVRRRWVVAVLVLLFGVPVAWWQFRDSPPSPEDIERQEPELDSLVQPLGWIRIGAIEGTSTPVDPGTPLREQEQQTPIAIEPPQIPEIGQTVTVRVEQTSNIRSTPPQGSEYFLNPDITGTVKNGDRVVILELWAGVDPNWPSRQQIWARVGRQSERGKNYDRLHEALKERRWRKADDETARLAFEISDRTPAGWLDR